METRRRSTTRKQVESFDERAERRARVSWSPRAIEIERSAGRRRKREQSCSLAMLGLAV
jgi:hypothetical protein